MKTTNISTKASLIGKKNKEENEMEQELDKPLSWWEKKTIKGMIRKAKRKKKKYDKQDIKYYDNIVNSILIIGQDTGIELFADEKQETPITEDILRTWEIEELEKYLEMILSEVEKLI